MGELDSTTHVWLCSYGETSGASMRDFNHKVKEASARFNQSVADIADQLEKESAELITYLNDEVVPAIRAHSTQALRTAAEKLSQFADYLDQQRRS
jgi:hypothetical protein